MLDQLVLELIQALVVHEAGLIAGGICAVHLHHRMDLALEDLLPTALLHKNFRCTALQVLAIPVITHSRCHDSLVG